MHTFKNMMEGSDVCVIPFWFSFSRFNDKHGFILQMASAVPTLLGKITSHQLQEGS